MSGEDPELEEDEEDGQEEPGRPVAMPASPAPTLRRGLLGYRAKDVLAELEARREEAEELRRDVAALWLAFGQHERTIRHLIAALEALERDAGPPAPAPPPDHAAMPTSRPPASAPSPAQAREPAPATTPPPPAGGEDAVTIPADVISAQLSDLDDVLAAIEQATRSLERTYNDEIAPEGEAAAEAGETEDEDAGEGDEPGASEPERS